MFLGAIIKSCHRSLILVFCIQVVLFAAAAEKKPLKDVFLYAQNGNIPKLRDLRKSFGTIDIKNEDGDSLLQIAVKYNQLEVVSYLLNLGLVESINSSDSEKLTPLTRAIENKNTEIATLLMQKIPEKENQAVADANKADARGDYPATIAIKKLQKDLFYQLTYSTELKLNVIDSEKFSPLTRATNNIDIPLVEFIVMNTDASLTFVDGFGKIPLDYAKKSGNLKLIKMLTPRSGRGLEREEAAPRVGAASPVPPPPVASGPDTALAPAAPQNSRSKSAAPQEDAYTIEIPYGTNREKTGVDDADYFYGEEFAQNLEYGLAKVSIPLAHVKGKVEGPGFWDFGKQDPREHIILKSVDTRTKEVFLTDLAQRIAAGKAEAASGKQDANDIFVFIHGFNTEFSYAMRKTAQLKIDLEFKGVPVSFSWPSHSTSLPMPWDFKRDKAAIEASMSTFKEFLDSLRSKINRNDGECIHLVAHSLGNRALAKILSKISDSEADKRSTPNYKAPFCEVIMASPAVDAEEFLKDNAKRLALVSERVTIMASDDDKALAIQWLAEDDSFSYPLGTRSSEGQLALSPFANLLDVSKVSSKLIDFNHAKYSEIPEIINDLRRIIVGREPTKERGTLLERLMNSWFFDMEDIRKNADLEYWEMKKDR